MNNIEDLFDLFPDVVFQMVDGHNERFPLSDDIVYNDDRFPYTSDEDEYRRAICAWHQYVRVHDRTHKNQLG